MKFKILGSGGAMPVPRPFCQCKLCNLARKNNKYKRNSCSAFIEDINTLIDCPEDIGDSLNRENIKQVDNLFITHWHPDHTFGLRVLLEANFDFIENKSVNCINIYIAKKVYETLKEKYPAIEYYTNVIKVAKIKFIEDGDKINFNDILINVVGYNGKKSDWYAFLFERNNKKLLYSPCDTLHFNKYSKFKNIEVWVTECGIFSHDKVKSELSFPDLIKRLKEVNPKKTILVHIEEIELQRWGLDYLRKLKDEHKDINFEFAHDGLILEL
ncbi:MAG: MBL fold metallo-hydrolase [Nanoarchaeota archaeon]|nr:MBL fold metallo-hydrolase [Nanoarchaeota archaeon]MBU1850079.1 MBL fold metallo-hydrolase [Nanoarchaeota archaeon]